MARRPRDWEIPVADQERLDEMERSEQPVGPLPEPPYFDKQGHRDVEGVEWFWDKDVRMWCVVTAAFVERDEDWLGKSQRHYCFLGGPKHWQREKFKAMRVGEALNTLDEGTRPRPMYVRTADDWPIESEAELVQTSAYEVRRFHWHELRRDFLVYENAHADDLSDMLQEFMETYYTTDGRRIRNGRRHNEVGDHG